MNPEDLNHRELLALDPEHGAIRFAGQRAVLFDAAAMGLLRKSLVETVGIDAARAVLTQFGFAHGFRTAEAMRDQFKDVEVGDWVRAQLRVHALQGLFELDPKSQDLLSRSGSQLGASYEAEQHTLHFGPSDVPVCWTICGLLSGYLSHVLGQEIFVLEDRCTSKGDACCHLVGRTRVDWGEERAEELKVFQEATLKTGVHGSRDVVGSLDVADRQVRSGPPHRVQIVSDVVPLGIVAKSEAMVGLVELTRRVAKVDSTVVITGESGSGKERIARLLHEESPRAAGPFIAVSCGAMADALLESELFGHARGSFTGASRDRIGLFEAANGGTLLLDEVGEISPGMQVKLLRAVQQREIRRLGENHNRHVDVRLLAATHRDLAQGVRAGTFRQDLYYRLKVVELHVPPLREREADILPLARLLLSEAQARMNREGLGLTPAAVEKLLGYAWPGNVRELENVMERAVALATHDRIGVDDLPEEVRHGAPDVDSVQNGVRPLCDVEKAHILASLRRNAGNQALTAAQLQIGTATLYRKLKNYGDEGQRAKSTPPPRDTFR